MTADVLRLVATDAASGPQDLADVARLLHAHAMPAAAWKIEGAIELIAGLAEGFDKMTDAEAKYLKSSRTVADAKQFVARIRELLEEYE